MTVSRLFFVLLAFWLCLPAIAQELPPLNELKTGKLRAMAKSAERNQDTYSAIDCYDIIHQRKPKDYGTAYHLAQLKDAARDYQGAYDLYALCYKDGGGKYTMAGYHQARMMKMLGKYDEAKTAFQKFTKSYKGATDYSAMRKLAEAQALGCDSAQLLMQEQLNVELARLPNNINKPHIEFNPIPTPEGGLIFGALPEVEIRQFDVDSMKPKRKFYIAEDLMSEAKAWEVPMNIPESHTGNGAFSLDGQRFYFAKCDENWSGVVECALFYCEKQGNGWSDLISLGEEVNAKGTSNSQPTVGVESRKGAEVIYFTSNREGGRGGSDLWYTVYNTKRNSFKAPKNLGRKINTLADETTPYFHDDTKMLYFSSNGHAGLGGMDIFSSRGETRKWLPVTNIGYPINTSVDEQYFVLKSGGEEGFFTSNRSGGNQMFHATCCDDIYHFKFREFVSVFVEGTVVEIPEELYIAGSGDNLGEIDQYASILDAQIKLYIKENGGEVLLKSISTDTNGTFSLPLEVDKEYRVEVVKQGYFSNYVELNTINQTYSDTLLHNLGISRLNEEAIVVPSIYYNFDSAALTNEAKEKLSSTILAILEENPTIKIEIGSHTDSEGTDAYNKKLSQQRAESVVEYLEYNGIDKKRLKAKGYGESKPLADNKNADGSDNPEGRQKNRRTDFRITGYLKDVIYEVED